ncbi:DUF4142 domain-containing protein [Streptomyces mirabilis]|nr:DUF4142 domain-containing protein [Streptomyces mirabilis]
MRSRLLTVAVFAGAITGLCAPQALSVPSVLGQQDTVFITMAHQSNLAEIAAGQDAQKNATTSCVKEVGATLVRDHKKLDASLSTLAKNESVPLPTAPSAEQQATLKSVQAKAGTPDYDKAWLTAQEAGHKKALALIDEEISKGQAASVIAAARGARPVVAMHLEMVKGGTCHSM